MKSTNPADSIHQKPLHRNKIQQEVHILQVCSRYAAISTSRRVNFLQPVYPTGPTGRLSFRFVSGAATVVGGTGASAGLSLSEPILSRFMAEPVKRATRGSAKP